jgi:hypothetical protein
MTGFDSKRSAAQAKLELADAYALAVAATPHMPTPLERKLAVVRMERARNALEAALEQPCVGKDPRCPCQDGDACHYKDCGDTKARPVQQAEPVAWIAEVELSVFARSPKEKTTVEIWKKPVLDSDAAIYTTPPAAQPEQRKPLTANEILNLMPSSIPAEYDGELMEFARAVEAAHNIKEGT